MANISPQNTKIDPDALLQKIRKESDELEISTRDLLLQLTQEIERFSKAVSDADRRVDADIEAVIGEIDKLADKL